MMVIYHENFPWSLLQKGGSEITCIISDDRRRREDWVVLTCIYIFRWKRKHCDGLIKLFAKLIAYFKPAFLKIHG